MPPKRPCIRLTIAHRAGAAAGRLLRRRARDFLRQLGEAGSELSLSLVTDVAIRKLNATWRRKDKATDVLSFPAGDMPEGTPGPKVLGDVVISLDTAKRQAKENSLTLEDELSRYLAHGILHLLGHDHKRPGEAKRMAELEDALLGGKGMLHAAGVARAT